MKYYAFAVSLLAFVVPACPPSPVVPIAPDAGSVAAGDAGPADRYTAACENLHLLHCAEGEALNCAATMRKADGILTNFAPVCVATSGTVEAVRACSLAWRNACK